MRFAHDSGPLDLTPGRLIVAGWTGRDRAAVDHHIAELAELGIAPPSAVPLFYRCSTGLLTQGDIEVLGPDTSGEVEPLLIRQGGGWWLGLASDQTDRRLEAVSVAASKQVCPKPVAPHLWRLEALDPSLDRLELRCHARIGGQWTLYQEGTLGRIRPLADLAAGAGMQDGDVMLCGTLPAIGGVRPASAYRMALHDPALDRTLTLDYAVTCLPVIA